MTPINRPLARESADRIHSGGRTRSVIVELDPSTPTLIGFRLKGTRRTYYLPIAAAFRDAMRGELARQRAERKKARQAKR